MPWVILEGDADCCHWMSAGATRVLPLPLPLMPLLEFL